MDHSIEISPVTELLGSMLAPSSENERRCMPDAVEVIPLIKARGALLFRGFDLDKSAFVDYTEKMSPDFIDYSGGSYARDAIDGDNTVLSVTGKRQFFAVPLHGEMFYTKYKPTILWFYCVSPPVKDGETTVCDGVELWNQLSSSTRQMFLDQDIKYIRHYEDGVWQGIYNSSDPEFVAKVCKERNTKFTHHKEDNSISTEYQCSAITTPLYTEKNAFVNNILPVIMQEKNGHTHSLVRFADDSKIPDEAIAEIKEVSDKLTIAIEWQAGDLVMVDNTRLMHGRFAFNDTQRDLNMRMCLTVFE